jgi:hypothetical protein
MQISSCFFYAFFFNLLSLLKTTAIIAAVFMFLSLYKIISLRSRKIVL